MGWSKGQSGNPNGRPRTDKALKEYLDKKYGKDGRKIVDALDTLAASTKDDGVMFQCWKLLLAYSAGLPVQRQEIAGDTLQPLVIKLTDGDD